MASFFVDPMILVTQSDRTSSLSFLAGISWDLVESRNLGRPRCDWLSISFSVLALHKQLPDFLCLSMLSTVV